MGPESPYEVVILVASCTVLITGSVLIVRADERRLERAAELPTEAGQLAASRLERAWPSPSRDNALIGLALLAAPLLGLFAVWFYFFRTRSHALWPPHRWSIKGFALGLWWVLVLMVANAVVVLALAHLFNVPLDE